MVAFEGAAWTTLGAIAGLGLAVAVVLVHVVNPQSFHWTMELLLPWARLLALCLAVVAAGTLRDWPLVRNAAHYTARASGSGFRFALAMAETQPLLLQGERGLSPFSTRRWLSVGFHR